MTKQKKMVQSFRTVAMNTKNTFTSDKKYITNGTRNGGFKQVKAVRKLPEHRYNYEKI